MILYLENPKDSSRKLLELINEFGKVAEYKINTQKSTAFLYTNNERSEREIREAIPYTMAASDDSYQQPDGADQRLGFHFDFWAWLRVPL